MSGYKLMYNTPDGGKGSLGLMKNYAFNKSMCDGIYLKQIVPPSTTETTLTMAYHASTYSIVVAGGQTIEVMDCYLNFSLSESVDEYITVVVNAREKLYNQVFGEYYYKDQSVICIISPGKKTYNTALFYDHYIIDSVYVYAGKRLVFHEVAEETGDDLRHKYFNAILKDASGNIKENTVAPNTITMTCNNETVYVYPLCKEKPVILNNNDGKISSIYMPAFNYKDEVYYPSIKITNNKEDVLNKVVNYVPSFVGDAIKEENSLKDEDIAAEDTSGVGDSSGDISGGGFNPDDFDFTPPEFVGGLVFPENTFNETTKEIVKESITTAVKDTTIIEARPVENTGGNTGEGGGDSGDTGGSENNNYTIIGADAVQFEVDKSVWGIGKYLLTHDPNNNTDIHSGNYIPNDYYPLFDNDGNIKGVIVQIYNEDGSVAATYVKNTDEHGLSGAFKQLIDTIGDMSFGDGTLYKNPNGGFTYIDNAGNITISDGTKGGTRFYEFTGGTNNIGHDVYYGPDGFPVYIYTDPDTGEKIIM